MKEAKSTERNVAWRICCGAAVLLAAVSFTPLVIPAGRFQPALVGLPFTLWVGVLVSIAFVGLTYVGTRVHPDNRRDGVGPGRAPRDQ
jgi:hypothetical protein